MNHVMKSTALFKEKAFEPFLCFLVFLLFLFPGPARARESLPKVIVLEFHGMKRGVIQKNLDRLPHFRELILGPRNRQGYVRMKNTRTTIPVASQPAVAAMYTGLYPRRTGVVSTIWFDRRTTAVHTLISYGQQRMNRILSANGARSLFEYAADAGRTSMTAMLMLTNGADWSLRSGAFFWGNASALTALREGRWFPDSRYVDDRTISALLTGRLLSYDNSLSNVLRHRKTLPDVTVVQLLGTDLYSHFPPAFLRKREASMDEIQGYYARTVLDPLLGRIMEFLKRAGWYDRTVFVLISEHGFIKIRKLVPDALVDRSLSGAFRLPGFSRTRRDSDAVVMIGACTKEVYLKNRAIGRWTDPPRLLLDVKPAVDLLLSNPRLRGILNAMVVRKYPGERSEGIAEHGPWWTLDWRTYAESGMMKLDFLRALKPLSHLSSYFQMGPFLAGGLTNQYTRDTAPDIKIVNRKGIYFERDFTKYGHHGSFYPEDCYVPFWIAGPGLSRVLKGRYGLEEEASTLDLVPTVCGLLGIPQPEGLDGKNRLQGLSGD